LLTTPYELPSADKNIGFLAHDYSSFLS